jgi:hypothetical protein
MRLTVLLLFSLVVAAQAGLFSRGKDKPADKPVDTQPAADTPGKPEKKPILGKYNNFLKDDNCECRLVILFRNVYQIAFTNNFL